MTRNPVEDGENFSAVYWSAIVNAVGNEYIDNGCNPSKGTGDFDINIASGDVYVAGGLASVSSQTVTLSSSSSDDRVDLVTIDSNGTASVTQGAAATDPNAPSIPTDEVLVAAGHVRGSSSSLSSSDILDYRVLEPSPYAVDTLTEIDAQELSGGDGSSGQVLESDGTNASWVTRDFRDASNVDRVDDGTVTATADSTSTLTSLSENPVSNDYQYLVLGFFDESGGTGLFGNSGQTVNTGVNAEVQVEVGTGLPVVTFNLVNDEGSSITLDYRIWRIEL